MVFLSFLPNLPLTICTVFCISNGARLRKYFSAPLPLPPREERWGGGGREACASQEVIGAAFLPG